MKVRVKMNNRKNRTNLSIGEFTPRQKALLVQYYPLVSKIVNAMRGRLPSYADLDELHSEGVSGLADAVKRLDPKMENTYGGYIAMRVKGAVLDALRRLDYMPRSARNEAKKIERLKEGMEQDLGREPKEYELRDKMGLTQKQFDKVMLRTRACSFISLNHAPANADGNSPALSESIADENAATASEQMERHEMDELLKERVVDLPERQKRIIEGYYFENRKLGDIAKDFGVTEARVCQIHGQALQSLKAKLKN